MRWIRPWSSKVVNQVTETKFADKKVAAVRKWEINYKYLAKTVGLITGWIETQKAIRVIS